MQKTTVHNYIDQKQQLIQCTCSMQCKADHILQPSVHIPKSVIYMLCDMSIITITQSCTVGLGLRLTISFFFIIFFCAYVYLSVGFYFNLGFCFFVLQLCSSVAVGVCVIFINKKFTFRGEIIKSGNETKYRRQG